MNELTNGERTALESCEDIIARGRATFVKVGHALSVIRDGNLHRATHKRFEDYCQERWNFTRQNASLLIKAAEVHANVSTVVDSPSINPRQARELAKAPVEQQAEVWQEVCEETDRPTAAKVKEVVDRRREEMDAAKSFHQRGGDEYDDEPEPSYSDRFMDTYDKHCQPIFDEADEVGKNAIRLRLEQRFET